MSKLYVLMVCLVALLASGCVPGGYEFGVNRDKPEEKARAELLSVQAAKAKEELDYQETLHGIDIDARMANVEIQQGAARQAIIDERDNRMELARAVRTIVIVAGEAGVAIVKAIGAAVSFSIYLFSATISLAVLALVIMNIWLKGRRVYAEPPIYRVEVGVGPLKLTYGVIRDQLTGAATIIDPLSGTQTRVSDRTRVDQFRTDLITAAMNGNGGAGAGAGAGRAVQTVDGWVRRLARWAFGKAENTIRRVSDRRAIQAVVGGQDEGV